MSQVTLCALQAYNICSTVSSVTRCELYFFFFLHIHSFFFRLPRAGVNCLSSWCAIFEASTKLKLKNVTEFAFANWITQNVLSCIKHFVALTLYLSGGNLILLRRLTQRDWNLTVHWYVRMYHTSVMLHKFLYHLCELPHRSTYFHRYYHRRSEI